MARRPRPKDCRFCGTEFWTTRPEQPCCSRHCAQRLRFAEAGCGSCIAGPPCDNHQSPPVCVCDQPAPDSIGQCRICLRPYKPQVPGFDECRRAWLAQTGVDRPKVAS